MKIGIIGFGFMGGVHLAAIERIPGATVTAIASRTRPLPDAPPRGNLGHVKSSRFPVNTPWYSDWRQLLDSDIDAVDICLPTHLHKDVAMEALARGKHVLCEKPMALSARDCDELLEAAGKSGRVFMVAHVLRFAYPYLFAASFLHQRLQDRVKECTMIRRAGYPQWSEWLSRKDCSGGASLDLLIHDIDYVLKLFGEPTAVSAISDGDIDTMHGTLLYPGELKVNIHGGWYAPETQFSAGFQIQGAEALLSFQDGVLQQTLCGQVQRVEIPEHDEYFEQMKYFVECCRNHTVPARCLPAESAQAVRLANLLAESRARDGKELPFDTAAK